MSAGEIYSLWTVWLVIAGVLVAAAAALLLTILALARRIAVLAGSALAVVSEIEHNTGPVWQLNASHKVAGQLLAGAEAIRDNAVTIVDALGEGDRQDVA